MNLLAALIQNAHSRACGATQPEATTAVRARVCGANIDRYGVNLRCQLPAGSHEVHNTAADGSGDSWTTP